MVKSEAESDTSQTAPPSTSQDMPYGTDHLRKMFVGGLDHRTTDEKLKNHFEQFGNVIDVIVMKDPKTKRSRGFGFVTFSDTSMVDAVQVARPHKIDNKIVESKRAVPKSLSNNLEANATVKKVYLCGNKDDLTEDVVKDYFSKYGNIITMSIVDDKDLKNKEWAILEFDDYDAVDQICLGGTHSISGKLVDVKKLLSKDDHAKIQAAKTARENHNNHTNNNSNNNNNNNNNNSNNSNFRGGSAGNNPWPNQNTNSGQAMNMNGAGYGPVPGWGANSWQNQPAMVPNPMGCNMAPPNMMPGNMGFGPMAPGMYPGNMCMPPAMGNMGPSNMTPYGGGYGNMVSNYGMPMSDPSMYSTGTMSQPVTPSMDTSTTNTSGTTNTPNVGMTNANSWNYNPYAANPGWGNPNFTNPYQQNYAGGPMRNTAVSTPSTRNAPYNSSTVSTNSTNNYGSATSNGKRY